MDTTESVLFDETYVPGKDVIKTPFVIATRHHLPGSIQKSWKMFTDANPDSEAARLFEWKYNESPAITKEVAGDLAKPSHKMCGGKGYLEFSRIPVYGNPNNFYDSITFCDCALKNGEKMSL